MIRHISPEYFYELPSGNRVHPNRLIHKDGTLMWKHALLYQNVPNIPKSQAHESHIIKTAQRLEELNTWVSQGLDPWEFLKPLLWYNTKYDEFAEGIAVCFKHTSLPINDVFETLKNHLDEFESLVIKDNILMFRRCQCDLSAAIPFTIQALKSIVLNTTVLSLHLLLDYLSATVAVGTLELVLEAFQFLETEQS